MPCLHPGPFFFNAVVVRLADDIPEAAASEPGGFVDVQPATGFRLELTGRCEACGDPVAFPGLPFGLALDGVTASPDGTELRMPVTFGAFTSLRGSAEA